MRRLTLGAIVCVLGACSSPNTTRPSTSDGGSSSSSPSTTSMMDADPIIGPITDMDDIELILAGHNDVRQDLDLDALTWSMSLASVAAEWAEGCADANRDLVIDHNEQLQELQLGENIWAGTKERTGDVAVDEWNAEAEDYDYDANTCAEGADCGHYTQVVWADTTQVGCGRAFCEDLQFPFVIICNYRPPGNIGDGRPY